MRILPQVKPTPEQLTILADNRPGAVLIRGAAGSGKTTTALLRLTALCGSWRSRRERLGLTDPVRVLVLTYNRTLKGYINELAAQQVRGRDGLELRVETFGKWSKALLQNDAEILEAPKSMLRPLVSRLPADPDFLIDEVDYLLGRFSPDDLDAYVPAKREGRGRAPRIEHELRRRLLDEVVVPYQQAKAREGVMDWNDIALAAGHAHARAWDVVIVDEAQDFSANQVRTIARHLATPHSITFVMDATQRIYPRYFTWKEAGIELAKTYRLTRNYRNTREIAAFARALVEPLPTEDDGTLPDFTACSATGPLPIVVAGPYSAQIEFMLDELLRTADFKHESVAFLKPRGGAWFDHLRTRLDAAGIDYVPLTRSSIWPTGPEAVALSTIYSAKGLEFDHVVMPGLSRQVTPHGSEEGDGQLETLRKLIAMGAGRARKSLMLGFKPGEASSVFNYLKRDTFTLVQP